MGFKAGIGEFGVPFLNGAMSGLSPGRGRFADDAPERAGEMRLIAHAAAQGNLTQRCARRKHETLSEFDAPMSDPDAGRHAKGALECATEVTDADVERRRKVFDDDLAGEVGIDMRREPSRLPCRETAARDLSGLGSLNGMPSILGPGCPSSSATARAICALVPLLSPSLARHAASMS